jgi:hypothetical protein
MSANICRETAPMPDAASSREFGLGEIGAHLGDAAGLHGRAAVGRLCVHSTGMGDWGDGDMLLQHAGEGRVGMVVEIDRK